MGAWEHQSLCIKRPETAAMPCTRSSSDDLDTLAAQIAERGLDPAMSVLSCDDCKFLGGDVVFSDALWDVYPRGLPEQAPGLVPPGDMSIEGAGSGGAD